MTKPSWGVTGTARQDISKELQEVSKPDTMGRLHCRIPNDLKKQLSVLAIGQDQEIQHLVAEALEDVLQKYKEGKGKHQQ